MLSTRVPLRVSFIGGGTDLLPFASEYGGCVVAAAIDKYIRIYDDYIQFPFNNCSGLGTSAAIAVAKLKLVFPNLPDKTLFKVAVQVENFGQQDQAMAIIAGFQSLTFSDYDFQALPLIPPQNFEKRLALVYLGKRTKDASTILRDEIYQIKTNKEVRYALMESKDLAFEATKAIVNQDIDTFIKLVKEGWEAKKRHSSDICTPPIQAAQEHFMKLGAQAFKLCGAGSGGYALLIKPEDLDIGIPIRFAYQGVSLEA